MAARICYPGTKDNKLSYQDNKALLLHLVSRALVGSNLSPTRWSFAISKKYANRDVLSAESVMD